MRKIISAFILLTIFTLLIGCGGGTSGSGMKVYKGRVVSIGGEPLSNVELIIVATGDTTITNSAGEFSLESDAFGAKVAFLLKTNDFRSRFAIKDIRETSSHIVLDITVDTQESTVTVNHIQLHARMVGECKEYFDNSNIIQQVQEVPPGTICTLATQVSSNGWPIKDAYVELEYAACAEDSVWRPLTSGISQIDFEFLDSPTFCRYRVIVPQNVPNYLEAYTLIETLTVERFHRD